MTTPRHSSSRYAVGNRQGADGDLATVTISQDYRSSVQDVWEACTTADRLARWFQPVSGDLSLGGRYQVQGNASGTVTSCEPPRFFAATWEFAGATSWIEVRIDECEDGATLELTHLAEPGGEHWDRYGPGAVGIGWDLALLGLSMYLQTGASMSPAEAESWSVSEEGKAFLGASALSWAAAAQAAGTDPQVARAQAARTTAFYTGQAEPE